MSRKSKRNILLFLVILVITGAATGYYYFNKGPEDIRKSSAVNVDAKYIYDQFINDSARALKDFAGKILIVSGEVKNFSLNQQQQVIILLKTNIEGASVNCTMEQDPGKITLNEHIRIKGIIAGIGQGDEELGISPDVYMTRCYLIK